MNDDHFKLIYPDDYNPNSEDDVEEVKMRGYLSHSCVKVNDNDVYPVYFSDTFRLSQDLLKWSEQGKPCFAPVGLIIIEEVTPIMMEKAVQYLCEKGYFTFFTSMKDKKYQVMY